MIPPYPLLWPEGIKRTARPGSSQFRTTLTGAMKNVQDSLTRFANDSGQKITDLQITSNVGLMGRPADPGIAVWFNWDGDMRCIAVDKYAKVEDNLQAIHHVVEARRTELRHAGIEMVRTTFKGFRTALPAPNAKKHWHVVLGVDQNATLDQIQAAYRALARQRSGTEFMTELNVARDDAVASLAMMQSGRA